MNCAFEVISGSATARGLITIHDTLMAYVVQDFLSLPNAETYSFQTSSFFVYFSYYWDLTGRPDDHILQQHTRCGRVEGCFSSELLVSKKKKKAQSCSLL